MASTRRWMLMDVLMMGLLCEYLLRQSYCGCDSPQCANPCPESRPIPFDVQITPRLPEALKMLQKERERLGLNGE